jgi:hypothetical protein
MRSKLSLLSEMVVGLLFSCATLFADYVPNIADFNRCPQIGESVACGVLFVVNPRAGSDYVVNAYAVADITGTPVVLPYDGSDDTVYGVLNKSGDTILSLSLGFFGPTVGAGGQPLFALDGDGLCSPSIVPRPSGCGTGAPPGYTSISQYEGPGTYFIFINENKPPDPRGEGKSGTVGFNAGAGISDGGFLYFGLEDLFRIQACVTCSSVAQVNPNVLNGNYQIWSVPLQATVIQTAASVAQPEPSFGIVIGVLTCLMIFFRERYKSPNREHVKVACHAR